MSFLDRQDRRTLFVDFMPTLCQPSSTLWKLDLGDCALAPTDATRLMGVIRSGGLPCLVHLDIHGNQGVQDDSVDGFSLPSSHRLESLLAHDTSLTAYGFYDMLVAVTKTSRPVHVVTAVGTRVGLIPILYQLQTLTAYPDRTWPLSIGFPCFFLPYVRGVFHQSHVVDHDEACQT